MRRIAFLAAALAAVLAGLVTLYLIRPVPNSIYPPCVFYELTGLHCPGCGTLRATHALLHGRVRQALAYNPITPWLLPLLGVYGLYHACLIVRNKPSSLPRVRAGWIYALLAAIVLFWIARNIPAEPFTRIAPHEVGE